MRAIEVTRHGAPEVLRLVRRDPPPPGVGEARVAVRAAGVNFADVLARLGVYAAAPPPPFVPGIEIAGEVEGLGDGVDALEVQRALQERETVGKAILRVGECRGINS